MSVRHIAVHWLISDISIKRSWGERNILHAILRHRNRASQSSAETSVVDGDNVVGVNSCAALIETKWDLGRHLQG